MRSRDRLARPPLYHRGRRLRMSRQFMQLLAVAAMLDSLHPNIFRSRQREAAPLHGAGSSEDTPPFPSAMLAYHPIRHRWTKRLRHTDAAVGRIIQRPLHPLHRCRHGRIHRQGNHMAGHRTDAFCCAWVCAYTLIAEEPTWLFFKGFFYLRIC